MSTNTQTLYGVARGQKILSGGFGNVEGAAAENGWYEARATDIGLTPDTYVATYEVTTTTETGRPSRYVAPVPEAEGETEDDVNTSEPSSDPTTTA